MVRNYKKKTNRDSLDENCFKNAIQEVMSHKMSEREAARRFNVRRSTLHSRIKKLKTKYSQEQLARMFNEDSGNESSDQEKPVFSSKYTVCQVFDNSQEKELVNYIKTCSDMNYGMTYSQIGKLAFEYACNLPERRYPRKWDIEEKAGIDWLKGFMKRNQNELTLRKPESTSLARATGFNKAAVSLFFDNYTSVLSKYQFKPEDIYNVDETGVATVLRPVKVVAPKGRKQVRQNSSAERGELTTFVGIIKAVGNALPPVYVFPRIRNPEKYLINGPTSSLALGSSNGWMTSDLFVEVLKHIKEHTKCNTTKPILLLLDNHETHITVNAINFCRANGIVLVSLPPHASQKLQPLDVGVYSPFKSYCATAFNDWMTMNPGKPITINQIASLTKYAFQLAFSQKNILSSFETPGLWPLNRLAFKEEDFVASYANQSTESSDNENLTTTEQVSDLVLPASATEAIETEAIHLTEKESNNSTALDIGEPQASTSKIIEKTTKNLEKPKKGVVLTPEAVRPYPRPCIKKTTKGKDRRGKSRIFTDTPEKNRLEEIEREKKNRKKIQEERKLKKLLVTKQVFAEKAKTGCKRTRKLSSSSSSSESEGCLSLRSDDVSDDFSEEENEPQLLSSDDKILAEDFLLVKFSGKAQVKYYIGKVREIVNENEYKMSFLRRKASGYTFYFPAIDDESVIERNDVVLKLPQPKAATTARTASLFKFDANLRSYNIC